MRESIQWAKDSDFNKTKWPHAREGTYQELIENRLKT